jgi:hypothetical protein
MGSRYGGVKQISAVGLHDECLLDYAAYDAKASGFGKVVYIIRKDIEKDFRERLFDRVAKNFDAEYVFQSPDSIFTADQLAKISPERKKPWGTIHAVMCAEKAINSPFAVINADDYYGREAFKIMNGHLSGLDANSTEHAMVGYILENTMSKAGSVSRGVCEVKDGYLESMREELIQLADTYLKAGDAIHDAIRESIRKAGGFLNCSNNDQEKKDMNALVFDSKKGYSETYPIRAMKLNDKDQVEVYIGTYGTIYTDRYLRGKMSEEHWMPLKNSNILFYQTILSVAAAIDEYL